MDAVTDLIEPELAEWHLVAEAFHSDSAFCEGMIDGLVFLGLPHFVVVGSVDEHGESRLTPEEVDGGAGDHILFLVEGEGFLGGHVGAEVAALQFEEDAEFGVAHGNI